ncbi:pyridoxine 5'-phosphate synthase [Candidatus Anaplasma sp. TIGMIC]|uniref:pyridoxine 5'-phosphate synthase n=1 Tax=Candidatus Anaplasma sp. TIGMIC TaxID=3020713 RepID=UPI00232E499F|nr:pyridoxine 5'-phosphate synthase [Candidatus Anaplasma sp. TIGMIC]MDB1135083.1 pyridoxine 5'-phosphate synthase [Candidatus Anaplasma sp. TIGMIC]
MLLGVNVDHVATLRNLRGTTYPSIVEAARVAVDNGADFITVHLREDRRHVRDGDLHELRRDVTAPLNLEMAATDEMITIAKEIRPEYVCIVPEKREEVTTESGLDAKVLENEPAIVEELQRHGIKVTLFLDPYSEQIEIASRLGVDKIELHVGEYCRTRSSDEFDRITKAAELCYSKGIECHAGHGIDYGAAVQLSKLRHITAINVGHFIVCEAVLHGMANAVGKMKAIITS